MIDYLAGALELTGKVLVGNKRRVGFIVHIIAGACWAVISLKMELYGLLLVTAAMFVVNVRNWIKWGRDARR